MACYLISYALVSPLICVALLEKWMTKSIESFVLLGQLLCIIPGKPGSYLRSAFYRMTTKTCSHEINIGFGSYFSKRDVAIGKFASIGSYCIIGKATIGESVKIASRVSITSGRHQHTIKKNTIKDGNFNHISIGEKTWIGEGAIIMADIGKYCVIGGGSVIVKEIPDDSVVVGNPGQIINANDPTGKTHDKRNIVKK